MLERTTAGGLTFWYPALDDGVGSSLRDAGEFAKPEVDLLIELHAFDPELAYVDVGANIGAMALPMAARFETAPVIACEAHPELHALLCKNADENRLGRIRAIHCAVSDHNGLAQFPTPSIHSAHNFGATGFGMPSASLTDVPLRTIDQICVGERIGTIKIDVEGHEAAVLAGAEGIILRDRPAVLFEAKNGTATTANALWFLERGYALFWFYAPFITPANEKKAPTDTSYRGDINLLALPEHRAQDCILPRLRQANEHWQSRILEMGYLTRYGIEIPS